MAKKARISKLRAWAEKDGRGYPDWALRNLPVVRRFKKELQQPAVAIEIGANENGLARFAGRRVIAVDVAFDHLILCRAVQDITPVVASLEALPFRADTADVCVCMDTFEHIGRPVRDAAAAEIVRVLKPEGVAAIAFPSADTAPEAEHAVRVAYRRATGGGKIRWLEEHAQLGLPNTIRMLGRFHELARETHWVTRTGNAPLWIWVWVWKVLMCNWGGRLNNYFQALLRLITPLLLHIGFGRSYRTIIWLEPRTPADADTDKP